jgi:hypothetical protein
VGYHFGRPEPREVGSCENNTVDSTLHSNAARLRTREQESARALSLSLSLSLESREREGGGERERGGRNEEGENGCTT